MEPLTLHATRYVTPLREGGSLPAIVEADDDGLYVLKFRGAGQGPKALIAELVAGELARDAGLPMPRLAFIDLDPELARTEPDPEIQDLIRASAGLNLGLDYLPGAVTFDPVAWQPDAELASRIVWFDAYVTNVDRSARNTNLMVWHRRLWLIDHGAALYFHHAWGDHAERARRAFAPIRDHVLLPFASRIAKIDADMAARITPERIRAHVEAIPEAWLCDDAAFVSPRAHREAYVDYLVRRLEAPRDFATEAARAHAGL
ncbi:HipA family kinase [Dokdonella sp. MW10]|uniref:HipA family kinase n=1 Tax=Dokdonella sp. MW10 TaxID=2992926 RepID=UPI003F822457